MDQGAKALGGMVGMIGRPDSAYFEKSGAAGVPTQASIPRQMERISRGLEAIEASVSGLRDKLTPVLAPVSPTPPQVERAPSTRSPESQLAELLEVFADKTEMIVQRLVILIDTTQL